MEYSYNAYTKLIDNQTYFFVKKYLQFSELKDVEPILTNYGMHLDFYKACSIASINDPAIREQLFREANATIQQAKVVDFNGVKFSRKTAKR